MKSIQKIVLSFLILTSGVHASYAQDETTSVVLSLHDFVAQTAEKDLTFQEILIDDLAVTYFKYLTLPVRDWIFTVKGQYDTILRGDDKSGTAGTASLNKLFPYIGTELEVNYDTAVNRSTGETVSSFDVSVSQAIAENAFGKADRYMRKITGIEETLAHYQVIEAYEDYLASLITRYYRWFFAYENLKTAENSHRETLKQLDNMIARQKSSIALDIDVNKIKLQVLAKKERAIAISDTFERTQNLVKKVLRVHGSFNFVPEEDLPFYKEMDRSFDEEYQRFMKKSRTAHIIELLDTRSEIQLDKDANALLPSINLKLGYTQDGSDRNVSDPDSIFFAGVSIELPITGEREHAAHEIARINRKKASITAKNTHVNLYTDLLNLYESINKTKDLITISQERITLAGSILKDELKNYSLGRATLNDLIVASDKLENNRFNKIDRSVQLKLLVTEWFRMTDQLVTPKDLKGVLPSVPE